MNLITGGTGLVGAHLLLFLLEKEEQVRALYRSEQRLDKTRKLFEFYQKQELFSLIDWVKADITDTTSLDKAFEGITQVYHCAAYISLSSSSKEMYKTNIEGTANIVNFCIDYGIKKLCYVSSIATIGTPQAPNHVATEETDWNPNADNTDYAISKYGGETEVFRGSQEGIEVVVVNPGIILGPEFWDSESARFFEEINKGMLFYTKGTTGFIAVTDVVRAMYELMKSEINIEKYILVGKNITFEDFLNQIATAIKAKKPSIYAKPWITKLASQTDFVISKLFFRQRMLTNSMSKAAHSTYMYSSEKIERELHFKFTDINEYIEHLGKHYVAYLQHKK